MQWYAHWLRQKSLTDTWSRSARETGASHIVAGDVEVNEQIDDVVNHSRLFADICRWTLRDADYWTRNLLWKSVVLSRHF